MKGSFKVWMVILGILVMGSVITFFTHSYINSQRKKMETELPQMAAAEGIARDSGSEKAVFASEESFQLTGEILADEETEAAPAPDVSVQENADFLEHEQPSEENESEHTKESKAVKLEISVEEAVEEKDLQSQLAEYEKRLPQLDKQIEQMRNSEVENFVYSVKNAAQTEVRIWERELDGIYSLLLESLDEQSARQLQKEQDKWIQLRDSRAEEAGKKNSGGSLESVDYLASVAASTRERVYQLLEQYQK